MTTNEEEAVMRVIDDQLGEEQKVAGEGEDVDNKTYQPRGKRKLINLCSTIEVRRSRFEFKPGRSYIITINSDIM